MRFLLLTASVSCLLLVACAGAAERAAPPTPPFTDRPWSPTSTTEPATRLHVGSFRVELEKTTLADVRREVGGGDIRHQGEGGDNLYFLCYTIGQTDRLWIASDGDIGGAEHRVTSVTGERYATARSNLACPALARRLTPVSLDGGLWLGTAEAEARRLLGAPSHAEGTWRSYDFHVKVPGGCEPDGFDKNNWLWYRSVGGLITTIWANQITTC